MNKINFLNVAFYSKGVHLVKSTGLGVWVVVIDAQVRSGMCKTETGGGRGRGGNYI